MYLFDGLTDHRAVRSLAIWSFCDQDGCSALQEFVIGFGFDIDDDDGGCGGGSQEYRRPFGMMSVDGGHHIILRTSSDTSSRNNDGGIPEERASAQTPRPTVFPGAAAVAADTGDGITSGSWNDGTSSNSSSTGGGGARALGAAAGETGGGLSSTQTGDNMSVLSLVLAFLARVMAPAAHEASALHTGGKHRFSFSA